MYTLTKQLCLALVCVLMFSSCTKDTDLTEENAAIKTADLVDYVTYSKIETEILKAVNDHRVSKGLTVLKKVDGITFLAADHNDYMIQNKNVSHDNFSYRYTTLVNTIGAKSVSENIGYGYRTSDAVVKAWLNSEGHRSNIEGNFTHFGISVSQDEDGKNYFTNIFARR
ncbi:CAP domain-containing protein [Antarcticibacterium arcticum]|uniref:CAP domain-containing protein n=1 Tax=Antarcticibacterium arcticum TaxID=2585771 RepID=A0A5B8YIY4_9FLAO|nr:CAP domain-containing protein [Antarcticibacterium arcticum]QED36797.1 CAP domain-containing protein [Antarcticibacterium arcticum]